MRRKIELIALVVLMMVVLSCGSKTEVQDEADQDYVRTQVAQTLMAEWAATDAPASEPTQEPTKQPGIRDNPIPLGQPLDLVQDNNTYFRITVLEVIRGDQAWQMIYQANQFNAAPEEGKEYIVAKIKVEYTNSSIPDKTLSINQWYFGTVSNSQLFEDLVVLVEPSPELNVELLPGGAGEGYIVGIVFKDDVNAMLYYKEMFSDIRFYMKIQ